MHQKDLLIISHLRRNGRESLTDLSKKTNIPISTIFDRIRTNKNELIKRHTALIDFSKLGFNTIANILIKVEKPLRDECKNFLIKNLNVNSIYKVNTTHDFLFECIFRDMKELQEFEETLEEKFKIKNKQVFFIIDELKKEEFLSQPEMLHLLV